jgi:D-galactarolactone isomerase
MHIYGDPACYPINTASPFKPVAGGTIDTYLALMRLLGLTRAVVVQPSAYGIDNRCTLDAMARIGADARGVAVVDESVSDDELVRLTKLGIRGLRYFMLPGGALTWESLPRLAGRVGEHGWHIQMQMDGRFLHEREELLAGLPGRLVIDHNGKFLEPVALDHPGVRALRRLLENGRTYVKTSGVYETSKVGPPGYHDVARLAETLIRAYPERCLWATNWPHPSKPNDIPDDSQLADLFSVWCGSEAQRHRILVETPAEVYGFAEASSRLT